MLRTQLLCLAALLALAAPALATGTVLFSSDFEPSLYTTGALVGQDGWASSSGAANATVSDAAGAVIDGTQSMLIIGTAGTNVRHTLVGSTSLMGIEVKMAAAASNIGQWWVALQKADTSGRSAAFGFNGGNVCYYSGGWKVYAPVVANQVYAFKAEADIAAKKWSLWVDGVLVADTVATYSSTPALPEEVYFYRGGTNASLAAADSLIVTSIPEPSSLLALLLGIGGVAGCVRRRR